MLAIVIPYYKLAFFEATLQSLAEQSDDRFMVYIGDDNSTENPKYVLDKYQNKIKFQYIRFQENYGSFSLVKQWNRCLEMVNNEQWVLLLGDDDVLEANVVAEFYPHFNEFNNLVDVVRFSTCKINALGSMTSEQFKHPQLESSTDFFLETSGLHLVNMFLGKIKFKKLVLEIFP